MLQQDSNPLAGNSRFIAVYGSHLLCKVTEQWYFACNASSVAHLGLLSQFAPENVRTKGKLCAVSREVQVRSVVPFTE